jgi:hypothetical protein
VSGIPEGWVVNMVYNEYSPSITFNPSIYLEFDIQESGVFGLNTVASHQTIYISKDKINWMTINSKTAFETI